MESRHYLVCASFAAAAAVVASSGCSGEAPTGATAAGTAEARGAGSSASIGEPTEAVSSALASGQQTMLSDSTYGFSETDAFAYVSPGGYARAVLGR